ncbi:MAG TPA: 2,3-bisphosphoglycerate-independent phosphoglycerate mutase [Candidatus Paceibacterota bacterium]
MKGPVSLIILDGWGYRASKQNNALSAAKIPNFNKMWDEYPHTTLTASEEGVGLPSGQIGNSEVGHMTIGAGTIIPTSLVRISNAAKGGEFKRNPVFEKVFSHVKKNDSTLHVMGLASPGGIHSHSEHLYAFLEAAKLAGVKKIAIHAFTDGRDVPPRSAASQIHDLEKRLTRLKIGHIATVSGRFYGMDRDNNWDRTEKFMEAALHGKASIRSEKNPSAVIKELYKKGEIDEHLKPMVFLDKEGNDSKIAKKDAVFLFNFRADRVRQPTRKLMEFAKGKKILIATMTEYDKKFKLPIAFPPLSVKTTLAGEISKKGLKQAHIAETEKFPHATYFLNGGRQKPHRGEVHILLQSRQDVPTHDMAPKMRAEGIADVAVKSIGEGTNFIFINFANADMVGHTGNVPAIIEGVEEVDIQLKRVVDAILEAGGACVISADHGNAEMNIDPETGEKHTAHTLSPVPCIVTKKGVNLRKSGTLADLAPTVLQLMELKKPSAMTGKSLISGD